MVGLTQNPAIGYASGSGDLWGAFSRIPEQ